MKASLYVLCIALCASAILYKFTSAGKIVCYYGSWASYRPGNGKCEPENIDPHICTHIIYSFVGLDAATNQVVHLDSTLVERNMIGRFNKLREANPKLKTIIAIGGWNEGSVKYSNMAASATSRRTFVNSVVNFLTNNNFDGFDIDWEYPAANGGSYQDKQNYALLVKELREEFDKYGYLLSAAVAAGKSVIEAGYDVPLVSKYLDFINIMAYDYHGGWEQVTGHHSPLHPRPDETTYQQLLNVNATVRTWLNLGASPEKLILGIGTYGISFTLSNPSNNGLFAAVSGPGNPGPYTQTGGVLGYSEILEKFSTQQWTVVRDEHYKTPYAYLGNQWVGYEDEESTRAKCNFAKSLGLGGGMVWSIETDDFRGVSGKKYPLLSVINEVFGSDSTDGSAGQDGSEDQVVGTTTTTTTTTPPTAATSTSRSTTTTTPKSSSIIVDTDDVNSYVLSLCPTKTHIRHPTDCSTFFTCTLNGRTYVAHKFKCQTSLVFDDNINACNWISLVKNC